MEVYRAAYSGTNLIDIDELDTNSSRKSKKKSKKQDEDEDENSNSEEEYSDWEGIKESDEGSSESKSGILKKKQIFEAEDSDDEETTVVVEQIDPEAIPTTGRANNVFPEMSKQVLQASLQKAKQAALMAWMYGFPEPSVYRDENDPLGLSDSEDDSESGSKESASKNGKKVEISLDEFKNKRRDDSNNQKKKKKKAKYLSKTERLQNVKKERNRSAEKRRRAKDK